MKHPLLKKGTQVVKDIQPYMTEGDWNVFNDKGVSVDQKVIKIVDRMSLLGIRNPAESTTKSCVALIACAHFKHPPDASVLHSLVVKLKTTLAARKATDTSVLDFMPVYPDQPSKLPAELYAHAYPSPTDQPALRIIDGYASMFSCVPMRSTHKALAKNAAAVQPQVMQGMFQDFLTKV